MSSERRRDSQDRRRQAPPPLRSTLPETYDLYVRYPAETEDDVRRIVGNHSQAYAELIWLPTRIELLATSLVEDTKELARSGHRKFGGGYQSLVHQRKGDSLYTREVIQPTLALLEEFALYPPNIPIEPLPRYSFVIQIRFMLTRPLYSRDDVHFYLHENPLMKDSVFKVPMIRATGWKGTLRETARRLSKDWPALVDGLFGAAADDPDEESGQKGRLTFYSTFFDAMDLEVINPHSRRTKAGTVPIPMEVVPPGATGYFTLAYVPFNLLGLVEDAARQQVAADLTLTVQMIERTMCRYGFSAKRSRGYGLAAATFPDRQGDKEKYPGGYLRMKGFKPLRFRSFQELNRQAANLVDALMGKEVSA
jgi:hypothetical protein